MSLEAEICPIFGLTLLELIGSATNIAIGVAIVGIMIAMGVLVVNAIQIKKQSQISSANLILELLQPWRKQSFKDFLK